MKKALVFGPILLVVLFFSAAEAKDSCLTCHGDFQPELAAAFKKDIHAQAGLSCADCHGGAPEEDDQDAAMSKEKGFRGKPARTAVGAFCDRCHGNIETMRNYNPALRVDQYREYLTSVHGKLNQEGDPKPATCVDCHGVHGILPPSDTTSPVYPKNVAATCGRCHANPETMKDYGIPTNQVELYRKSVHAHRLHDKDDLSSPTCNDCHGNHGAVPPGVRSVVEICGRCHEVQEEKFKAGPHAAIFEKEKRPACTTCHSNHLIQVFSDADLTNVEKSVCSRCHRRGDKGRDENRKIAETLSAYTESLARANKLLGSAESQGIDVSTPRFILNEANDDLIKTRVAVHTMQFDEVKKELEPGSAAIAKADERAGAAIRQRRIRKYGLTTSVFFILLLAIAIYLYQREREREAAGNRPK
jgi:cytochrome c553